MSTVVNAKMWQRNRALELHKEFQILAAQITTEGLPVTRGLKRLAKALNGRLITAGLRAGRGKAAPMRVMKAIKCSGDGLYRPWRKWNEGGCTADALLLDYRYVAPESGRNKPVPNALAAEIQRRCTLKTGGRDKTGLTPLSAIYDHLCDDFRNAVPIPGINYHDYPLDAEDRPRCEFPWSYKTLTRHAPADHERALGNRGVAAFRQKACHVTMDYSKLRKCELFMLDDVRLDLVCINEATGKAVEVKCYIMMEVASRSVVAFFLKPKDAITQENVDELVAHGLQVPGFGIGIDYLTYIKFERGTVACSEAAQRALEAITEGRIRIIRTSMDGGITWVGAARDRSSGHAAGKAVIESFMRRLHYALLHLPGQIGNNYDNAPASVGQLGKAPFFDTASPARTRREFNGSFVDECERLAQFALNINKNRPAGSARLRLQLPGLYLFELQQLVKAAVEKLNHEPGHNYADHGEFAQAEIEPGVWEERDVPSISPAPDLAHAPAPAPDQSGATVPVAIQKESAAPAAKTYTLTAPAPVLTPKQRNGIYWRLWKAAEKADQRADRIAITHRVLGRVVRIKDMTDEQFTKVVHVFESIAKSPTSSTCPDAAESGGRVSDGDRAEEGAAQ